MQKLICKVIAVVAMVAATIPVATAAAGSNSFAVTATVSSACTLSTFSGPLAFGTVVAFVAPSNPTAITANLACTRSLTGVTAAFDSTTILGTNVTATPSSAVIGSTDGVLGNGLHYTLSGTLSAVTAGSAPASGTLNGTGDTYTFTVNGAMVAQAGACTGTGCTQATQSRTVTLSY